jgi:hypothetical protein
MSKKPLTSVRRKKIGKKVNLPTKRTLPEACRKHQIKPGEVRNPNGRSKGSRNKFAEAFLLDMQTAWNEQGKAVIDKVISTKPTEFLRVAASILPKELILNEGESALDNLLETMEEHELRDFVAAIRSIRTTGVGKQGQSVGVENNARAQPNSIH